MAEVNKGKPQKRLKLYILVEVLKEGPNFKSEDTGRVPPKCSKHKHFHLKGFCGYRTNRNQSCSVFCIPFLRIPKSTFSSSLSSPPPWPYHWKYKQHFRLPARMPVLSVQREILFLRGLHFHLTFLSPRGSVQTFSRACLRTSWTSSTW